MNNEFKYEKQTLVFLVVCRLTRTSESIGLLFLNSILIRVLHLQYIHVPLAQNLVTYVYILMQMYVNSVPRSRFFSQRAFLLLCPCIGDEDWNIRSICCHASALLQDKMCCTLFLSALGEGSEIKHYSTGLNSIVHTCISKGI